MYRNVLFAFILLHVLGDFYFQSEALSSRKAVTYRHVLLRGVVYAVVIVAGMLPAFSFPVAIAVAALSLLHVAIDSAKYLYLRHQRRVTEPVAYAIDQFIHILLIVIAVAIFQISGLRVALFPAAERMLNALAIDGRWVLGWACVIAVIGKPTNVTIKKLLTAYKPAGDSSEGTTYRNAGAFIGTLERIIIALLLSVNQYAAIGLVLTAKSVARFDKISKDQAFAEYYLLGTLLSTLAVILSYMAFR